MQLCNVPCACELNLFNGNFISSLIRCDLMVCKAIEFSIHYLWTFLQGILTKAWKCLTWKRPTCSTHIAMLDQPEIVEKIKVSSLFVSCLEVTAINFRTINYIWLNYWHARILEITLQFIWIHTRHSHFHSYLLQCTAWFIIGEQNESIRSKLCLGNGATKWKHTKKIIGKKEV